MKPTARTRISKALAQLIARQPFFGVIAMGLVVVERADVETMATDGIHLFYAPAFVDEISDAELRGTICHEVLHVTNFHMTRRGGRDPKRWNIAADYAINPLVLACGEVLPSGILLDPAYARMTAERIYSLLPDDAGQGGAGGNGIGGVLDAVPSGDKAEIATVEARAQATMINAAAIAHQKGNLPGFAKSMIRDIRKPKVDWRAVLRRFVDESMSADFDFDHADRRFIGSGIYLPGMVADGMGELGVIVDTSGSIDRTAFRAFFGELAAAVEDARADRVRVLQCDTKITAEQVFEQGEPITPPTVVGGGGTNMAPAFAAMENPAVIVCFTDLQFGGRFPPDPGVPVLWARWTTRGDKPPYGEVIDIT